jgi:hypothetical protein
MGAQISRFSKRIQRKVIKSFSEQNESSLLLLSSACPVFR